MFMQVFLREPLILMADIVVCISGVSNKMVFVQDPIRSLVEHPDYARLYLDDAIYGTAGLELKMAVDLIVENMPPDGYNVLEMYTLASCRYE